MNILLLGNGFDLHHKLPTAYIDFLHTVNFLIKYYDKSTMDTVGKVFGDERLKDKSENIAKSVAEYNQFYSEILLDNAKIDFLIDKAKNNIWFRYFLSEANARKTWIDFEKCISKVIDSFNVYFNSIGESVVYDNNANVNPNAYHIIERYFLFFANRLDGCFWNVNCVYDEYIDSSNLHPNLNVIDKSKIVSVLYDSLCEFANMLKFYLQLFINSLLEKLKFACFISNPAYPRFDYVCTFNYTSTYEMLYNSKAKINHIHGEVKNNIVIGVNPDKYDDVESVNTLFVQFKKYYQRVFYRTDIGYLELLGELEHNDELLSREEVKLYVAGHSLDKTDEDIIKKLFEYADEITVFYHEESKIGDYINNLVLIYGKSDFDKLRLHKHLRFMLHEPIEKFDR